MSNDNVDIVRVQEIAGSYTATIPKKFAKKLGIRKGVLLVVELKGDKLVYKKFEEGA